MLFTILLSANLVATQLASPPQDLIDDCRRAVSQLSPQDLASPSDTQGWTSEISRVRAEWQRRMAAYANVYRSYSSGKLNAERKVADRLWAMERQFLADRLITPWLREAQLVMKVHELLEAQSDLPLDHLPYLFLPLQSKAAFGLKLLIPDETHFRLLMAVEAYRPGLSLAARVREVGWETRPICLQMIEFSESFDQREMKSSGRTIQMILGCPDFAIIPPSAKARRFRHPFRL